MDSPIKEILAKLESFSGMRSIKQKTRASVELKVITDYADRIAEQYKQALMDKKVFELFPEYELKVEYQPPKASSHIAADLLARKLIKDGRTADLLKIITISEKDLKELKDGAALIAKYRRADEDTKAGLKIGKMTKEEIKASAPEKVE